MPLREVGGILLLLVIVFVIGNLWFHAVESVLGRIKRFLSWNKEPPVWHTFPTEPEDKQKPE